MFCLLQPRASFVYSFSGDVYKLEANGTDNAIIQNTPGFQEASELVEYRLKYDVRDGQTSAHASKLAQIRNATSEALYHIRNGKSRDRGCVLDSRTQLFVLRVGLF